MARTVIRESESDTIISVNVGNPSGNITGIKGDQGIQGPPVPVLQELGQSITDAVSQKLLTDTVSRLTNVIGNFDNLSTKDKTSIVAAVNELLVEISKTNMVIANEIDTRINSLELETVKQADLVFGDSYTPYYESAN